MSARVVEWRRDFESDVLIAVVVWDCGHRLIGGAKVARKIAECPICKAKMPDRVVRGRAPTTESEDELRPVQSNDPNDKGKGVSE